MFVNCEDRKATVIFIERGKKEKRKIEKRKGLYILLFEQSKVNYTYVVSDSFTKRSNNILSLSLSLLPSELF